MTDQVYDMSLDAMAPVQDARSESYFQLVWRRFRKSKPAIIGGLIVLVLALLALFAEFFAPYPLNMTNARNAFIPPTRVSISWTRRASFICAPLSTRQVVEVDPKTFLPTWEEDTSQRLSDPLFCARAGNTSSWG